MVLPVYAGVEPEHLWQCLESLAQQTLPAQEVVVVEDGPLTDGLQEVLDGSARWIQGLRRIKLESNGGPGVANQAGLCAATGAWVAKMDADDICRQDRIETLLRVLREEPLDVLGSAMAEFVGDSQNVVAVRRNPRTHVGIQRRMRSNSPVNHPACIYRRSVALAAGGYSDMRYMEDYDLFARLFASGAVMANIDEPLVYFRSGPEMLKRRRSLPMLRYEFRMQRNLRRYGLIGRARLIVNLTARTTVRFLPKSVLKYLYRRMNYSAS